MSRSLPRRMLRAARLESALYEEVEAEPRSLGQAFVVVLLASGAGALGAWLGAYPALARGARGARADRVLGRRVAVRVHGRRDLLPRVRRRRRISPRCCGPRASPSRRACCAFWAALPAIDVAGLHLPPTLISDAWVVLASIVAVRQALDFSTLRAIATFGVAYLLLVAAAGGRAHLAAGLGATRARLRAARGSPGARRGACGSDRGGWSRRAACPLPARGPRRARAASCARPRS